MTTFTNPADPFSPFLPSTQNIPEEQDRLNVFLVDNLNLYADVINDKKIGVWVQENENFSGGKFFYKSTKITRNGYQTFTYIPSWIPMTLTLTSIPTYPIKNVDPDLVISQVWGSASKPCSSINAGDGDYFSFFGSGNIKIQFTMSDTQIVISTNGTTASYSGFIFVEYIRDGF